jgi:periplasmic divalent cation tolerance protein
MTNAVAALVWCPCPDAETARRLATVVLEEGLIACANILPGIESVFKWDGGVSSAAEVAVMFKTTADRSDELVLRLGQLHPYDTPAILGWTCDAAHPATLDWLTATISGLG